MTSPPLSAGAPSNQYDARYLGSTADSIYRQGPRRTFKITPQCDPHLRSTAAAADSDVAIDPCRINSPLFTYKSSEGTDVPVYQQCVDGSCSCVYMIKGIKSQLRPCRFAALLCSEMPIKEEHTVIMDGITDVASALWIAGYHLITVITTALS